MQDIDVVSTILKDDCRILACISAHKSDGTTTVANALCKALFPFSSTDVLLVDLSRPTPPQISPENTISHFFRNEYSEIKPLRQQNGWLSLLSPGSDARMQDFLDLRKMTPLWEKVRAQYHYTVIDLPSFSTAPELAAVARQADGAILVINCPHTRWEVALNLKQRLHAAGVTIVGAVLNRRRYTIPDSLYSLL